VPGGARRLVLLASAAGRRGPLVGEVLTGLGRLQHNEKGVIECLVRP
jgi:hypothetical protein